MRFAYRLGRFWRVGKARKTFWSPAAQGERAEEGAAVLYRLGDCEVIFPGNGSVVTVRDMHKLLTQLVAPAPWPLGRVPAARPLQTIPGGTSGILNGSLHHYPLLDSWVTGLLTHPEGLAADLGKEPGWTHKLLDGDEEALAGNPLDDIEWSQQVSPKDSETRQRSPYQKRRHASTCTAPADGYSEHGSCILCATRRAQAQI